MALGSHIMAMRQKFHWGHPPAPLLMPELPGIPGRFLHILPLENWDPQVTIGFNMFHYWSNDVDDLDDLE